MNETENAPCAVLRTRTRNVISALSTVAPHFPFCHEPISSEHVWLLSQIFYIILKNSFGIGEPVAVCKDKLPSMVSGILSRVLTTCPDLFEVDCLASSSLPFFQSHISNLQILVEDAISKTSSDNSTKLSPRQIFDHWRTLWLVLDSLITCVPTVVNQNQRTSYLNLIHATRDLLTREIANIQWMLLVSMSS